MPIIKICLFQFDYRTHLTGVEWGEPGCAGLWKQGVDTQTGQTAEVAAVGSKWAGPEEGEIPQNDWP